MKLLNELLALNLIEVPAIWIKGHLGDSSNVYSGIGFPKKYQGKSLGDIPLFKVGDVSRSILDNKGNLCRAANYVSVAEAKELKGKIFPKGSTLFAKIGEAVKLNRRAILVVEGLADNNVMAVKAIHNEMDKFLHYYLRTIDLDDVSRATTVPSVRKGDIESLEIYYPPLAEQQQIANKLDELLAQVDTLKTRLDAIPNILKRFRQSVLAAAVSGRLTGEWRGNNECGGEVLLDDIALNIKYGTSKKCSSVMGATPVIRIPNISDEYVDLSDLKYADFDEKEIKNLGLRKGDILVIRSNGSVELVGKPALIDEASQHCLYAGYLIRLRFNLEKVLPKYILFALKSPQMRQKIETKARSTSGVNNINSKELAALKLVLPSLKEQTEIVRRVEQLFVYADQIEQRVKDAQSRANKLTQSILAKAFRGDLTAEWRAQNPDLITGENSAEALLARIKTERAAAEPGKKPKRAR